MKKIRPLPILIFILLVLQPKSQAQIKYSDSLIVRKVLLLKNEDGSHGSGIILKYHDRYLLLTANHVIVALQNTSKVLFSNSAGQVDSINLIDIFPTGSAAIAHVEGDVEILELKPRNQNDIRTFEVLSFQFDIVYPALTDIERQINVIVYGYPLYSYQNFEALSFTSFLSSGLMMLPRADTQKPSQFYLLQNPGMDGFSGGPVFVGVPHGGMYYGPSQTYLIGIVHGTESDRTGGKFALITPAWYIFNLLQTSNL
jgi:hypothetical protein